MILCLILPNKHSFLNPFEFLRCILPRAACLPRSLSLSLSEGGIRLRCCSTRERCGIWFVGRRFGILGGVARNCC